MTEKKYSINGDAPMSTTIEGIAPDAYNWVEQAAERVNAAEGYEYINLDRGVLTVNHLNHFMKTIPLEITFSDANGQLLYYNYKAEAEDMLNPRQYKSVGSYLGSFHKDNSNEKIQEIQNKFATGEITEQTFPFPRNKDEDKFVVNTYKAIYDEDDEFMGILQYIHDILPLVNYYLEHTGHKLVSDEGASQDKVIAPRAGQYNPDEE